MQLKDCVKLLSEMTIEELQEHLRQVRHRRTTERPVAKAREAKAEVKKSRGRMSAMDKMLAALSPEERAELMKGLADENPTGGQG